MYCPRCEVQFSGNRETRGCPYCGGDVEARSPSAPAESGEPSVVSLRDAPTPQRSSRTPAGGPGRSDTTVTEAGDQWAPGALIAQKYEVVGRLGAGGFGTVYKVRHLFRKKYYALKTPHPEFGRDELFRKRFEREIDAMERFVHPDAVMIRDSGVTDAGLPYFTMDFIEGESLKAILRREGRLPVERALRIVRRVLRVLEEAHGSKIIHRDVKPDNLLLTVEEGRETVKVLDFGVAKLLDLVGDTGSLSRGMRVGTPKYMSPEQVSAEPIDERSDLFSLGIVFYEMVTGQHPFAQFDDPVRVTAAILNRSPLPPRELVPDLPRPVNDHILWLLEKRVRRRPPSAAMVRRQLESIDEGASRISTVEAMGISSAVPRAPAVPLVLRQETSVGERRIFLHFKSPLTFGRSNDQRKGIVNDLLWRCLPCRSRDADPENWQRNLTISQRLGSIYPDGTTLMIAPAAGIKHGLRVGGVTTRAPVPIQSDRFHLAVGERALELDGYRVLRHREGPGIDLSCLRRDRPAALEGWKEAIGYSSDCLIDNLRLTRVSNWPLHEYVCVYRQVRIGSSATVELRLRGAGSVEGLHASILYESGEVFLVAHAEGIEVRGDLQDDGGERVGGIDLEPRTLLPLRPGLEIRFGDTGLHVDLAHERLFKSV